MRTARTRLAFSVLIVLAMVSSGLGVGYLSATKASAPAVSGPAGNVGTRSDGSPTAVSALGQNMNEVQENNLPTEPASATQAPAGVQSQDSRVKLTVVENNPANQHANIVGDSISQTPVQGTLGTRSFFDAGGPYGGPDCFEGSCVVHFEATTDDPTILFFRWDFNNDGVWDTPWLATNSVDQPMDHTYYGYVVAEGWDGVSTKTDIYFGYNLYPAQNYYWGLGGPNVVGWKFRAKTDMDAIALYFFNYYIVMPSLTLRIWDYNSGIQLGNCKPATQQTYSWTSCILGTPIHLVLAGVYMIVADNTDGVTSWLLFNNPAVPWDKVEYQDMWYGYSAGQMPPYDFGGGVTYVPMLDFEWRFALTVPLTQQDTAILDVRNVAPTVFDVQTDTPVGYEGTPLKFTAKFSDPGNNDWWSRWNFGDGTGWTDWAPIRKFNGGAKVLIYHSITGDIGPFKQKVIDTCGSFCLVVDDYDFGPLGNNAHMALDQLMQYDVLYVETNYGPIPDQNGAGNLIADYMDQKGSEGAGGIVTGWGPYIQGSVWEFRGRYFSDEYNPVAKGGRWFGNTPLGTIYVPGHPILDGINTLNPYLHIQTYTTTTNAIRVADFTDGSIAVATKENPIVSNGALSVAMPFTPWYQCNGDCVPITVNALKFASRQPAPTPMTMPIQLGWTSHAWADDNPVTTSPQDVFNVQVQVKDSYHEKVLGISSKVASQDFEQNCNYASFPPGWVNIPSYGWSCYRDGNVGSNAAVFWYYFNYNSQNTLESPSFDLSTYTGASLQWKNFWYAYQYYPFDGYVELSIDDGLTYPYILKEFHSATLYGQESKVYTAEIPAVSQLMKLRFRMENFGYYEWAVDNIVVYGIMGFKYWGLGNGTGTAIIANVPPTVLGGPTSGMMTENSPFAIAGMEISDPAIMAPTEWFAYRMDFDDGSPARWVYKGTLAPPRNNILIIHSFCNPPGNNCADFTSLSSMLSAMDLTGTVTGWDFFGQLAAPSLSYMMGFDVIIFASNWAYISYPPFDAARLAIGNNLASYMDAGRGGVVTFMFTFDDSPYYGDLFSFLGRYKDQQYGPFKPDIYSFTPAVLGTVRDPSHPVMKGVKNVQGLYTGSGDLQTTPGGIRLADNNAGGAFAGVKELANGARTCSIQTYGGGLSGADASKLVRNCIGWAIGGIPTADIPPVTHNWGDNGRYNVDVTLIDDDMGWTWDPIDNMPVADPMYVQSFSHHYIPVEVNNVDPTILGGTGGAGGPGAYTTADLCLRLSGNKGNDAVLTVMGSDGSMYSVRTSRVPGQPAVGCLPTITIDMTPSTKYTLTIAYDPTGDDGANPEWIFSSTWPDGKIKELRYTFNSNDGPSVVTIDNKQFKQLAIGSPITFHATAYDPGSDDLAFIWDWGDSLPYTIHDYRHPGVFYAEFQTMLLNEFPFSDPTFVKSTNSIRSPEVDPTTAHDSAKHTFQPSSTPLYVLVTVIDDDNGNAYPSTYLWPGMDIEFIQIDV